jgi:pilus assembly protein CpaB
MVRIPGQKIQQGKKSRRARLRSGRVLALLLGVQLVAGAIAAGAVLWLIDGFEDTLEHARQVDAIETTVLVATRDIPIGTTIGPDDLAEHPFRLEILPDEVVLDPKQIVGRVASQRILAGDLIRRERLAPAGSGEGFSAILPQGMRAFSFDLTGASRVSGFVQPDTRVDVIVTLFDLEHDAPPQTETVLSDVRVLAVDERYDPQLTPSQQLHDRVTLAVDPTGAQRLTHATRSGKLYLTLRPANDARLATAKAVQAPGDRRPLPASGPSCVEQPGTRPDADGACRLDAVSVAQERR